MNAATKQLSRVTGIALGLAIAASPVLAGKSDRLVAPEAEPEVKEAAADPALEAEPLPIPVTGGEARDETTRSIDPKSEGPVGAKTFAEDVCRIIRVEARRRGLPEAFFARLIWRESTFDPDAVSPKGAQGIAQFMPYTAEDRGLKDPFSPHQALPHSAHLLADLKRSLGNLGLAAAGYNAGEKAVSDWLAGNRSLPYETQEYVLFITGQPAENWAERGSEHPIPAIGKNPEEFNSDCVKLVKRQLAPRSGDGKIAISGGRGPWKPWGVVLSGGFNERRAIAAFNRIKKRYGALIGDAKPMVTRKKNASRGKTRLVSVMVGADNRTDADRLCEKLQAQGAACIVLKNEK